MMSDTRDEEQEEFDGFDESRGVGEEKVIDSGSITLFGRGLLGSVAGTPCEFFILANKDDINLNEDIESQVQVNLIPRVNKMKLVGTGLTPPTSVPGRVKLVTHDGKSPNYTLSVIYECTFAANYDVKIDLPKAHISHSTSLIIEPGMAHGNGCTVRGSGISGAVSEIPSSFRVLIGDAFKNPLKGTENLNISLQFLKISQEPRTNRSVLSSIEEQNGSFTITYTMPVSGEYQMSVFLNNEHISGSPFTLTVVPGMREKENQKHKKSKKSKTTKSTKSQLSESVDEMDPSLNKYENSLEQIVLIQKSIRMFLAIKKKEIYSKQKYKRTQLIQDLIKSEEEYITDLERLVNFYLIPVRDSNLISRQKVSDIFGNIEHINAVNLELIGILNDRISTDLQNTLIGDVFLSMASQLQSAYSLYINNYDKTLDTLRELETNKNFMKLIESIEENRQCDIMNLSMGPVKRLPNYENILKDILEVTEKDSQDFNEIMKALDQLKEVNRYVNDEKKRVKRIQRLMKISRKLYNCPNGFDFMNITAKKRDYLGQCPMTISFRGSTLIRQIIVFSDAIMVARKKISPYSGSRNLCFRYVFYFDTTRIIIPNDKSLNLVDEKQTSVTLIADSKVSTEFLVSLKGVLKRYQRKSIKMNE